MSKTIEHQVTIGAKPKAVFKALMHEKRHAKFTGEPAKISRKVGGAFSCYGGYITGSNVELEPARLIVQAWRSKNWPKGTWSLVTFRLSPLRGGKTKLKFSHAGVPAGDYEMKNQGWRTHYWQPLKKYLKKTPKKKA